MSQLENDIKILDCTLRDGGYYNNWDFDRGTVDRYLLSIKNSNIDVVELGFRVLPENKFKGPYAYTTDEFISNLDLPEGPLYGVMVNGKQCFQNPNGHSYVIKKLFQNKEQSPISLIRVAINFDHTNEIEPIVKDLKNMGYLIGLNLMQAHGRSEDDYVETATKIAAWGAVDVLYFADSLGNMLPNDVRIICQSLKKSWIGDLGIHTHNNKNLALINSLTAIENGVSWCDGTIVGMGRGAGNATTESLLLELSNNGLHNGNAKMIQPSVEDFTTLKNIYGWGANLYYHYASNNGIHPTFVQSLLNDKRYDNQQVLGALEFLAGQDATSYSAEGVRKAIYGKKNDVLGTWNPSGWVEDKNILLIGAGHSVKKYYEGIIKYIEKEKPIVLFLNVNRYLPPSFGDATIVSHETRALFDSKDYHDLNHPIILPAGRLEVLIKNQLEGLEILDYALNLEEDAFIIGPEGCRLKWPLAAAYALAVVTQGGASEINLVGFDGYSSDDPRQEEMNDVFFKYYELPESIPVNALTPTTYRVSQSSIFSPIK